MEAFITKIVAKIMNCHNTEQLYKVKHELSTKPFCGLERCYSLETIVFKILDEDNKNKIINHIEKLDGNQYGTHPHIFIDGDYLDTLDKKQRCFLEDTPEFITIIGSNNPVQYYAKTPLTNGDYIQQNLKRGDNVQIDTNAQLIYQIIWNYKKLFPNFMPIWIGHFNKQNVAIAQRLSDMEDYAGTLLHSDKKQKGSSHYKIFRNNAELIKELQRLLA